MNFKEIKERLKTQNNRATADPIFIVYDWERIPTSSDYSDKSMFCDSEGKIAENREELISFLKDNDCCSEMPDGIEDKDDDDLIKWIKENGKDDVDKTYYIEKKVFINVFFTEKSADDFIAQNHYHYTKQVHTYVNCLWRNPEMQFIREMIMSGKLDETTGA